MVDQLTGTYIVATILAVMMSLQKRVEKNVKIYRASCNNRVNDEMILEIKIERKKFIQGGFISVDWLI